MSKDSYEVKTITINLEEYKTLLMIKGRYEELKSLKSQCHCKQGEEKEIVNMIEMTD